jgi:outer membrane protein insertion porin family
MKIFSLFLLFFLATNAISQTIKSINFDGLVHISKPVAMRILDFKIGDEIDDKLINKSIKQFYNQTYFNDIWVENEAGNITFYFKEKPIISRVELKGWKESEEDIKSTVIQIKKGTLYSEKKLEAAKKRIIEAISQEGKIDSVVEIQKEYLENGSIKVTFLVNEGEEIIIKKINFSGAKNLGEDDFNEVIANKQHEWMGWFWGRNDGEMQLNDLEYDNLRIKDLYMQHGYLDAKVDTPFVRVNFNSYLADMHYKINEGPAYKISKISIKQAKNVIDDNKIKEIIKLKTGSVFNINTFRKDAQNIKTLIADLSYAYVQVIPDLKKDKDNKTVEVVFMITPGQKVKINNVIISGNDRTLDRIIRRELYLGPGDMYSLTDLKDSRNAIGRLGFFESNTIEEKRINENSMDLIVKVKEAPTGNIQVGGGYGTYGGLLLSIAVDDRNIWGSGINVGIKAEKSEMTKNGSFTISNPRLNDSDFSGNFSIYKSIYEYNDYTVDTEGTSVGVGHRFSRHITGYLGYGYSKSYYDDVNLSSFANSAYFESYSKSGVTVSVNFDNTDDYYLPREGLNLKQVFEKTGIGADANYFKSRTTFGKYNGLENYIGYDVIFRYKARYNAVLDNGYIPIAEKFYMGGIGSVRGYESYSLSPTETDSNGVVRRVGAKHTFSNNLELSFPLVEKAKMRLVTYADWGFIGDRKNLTKAISRGGYGAGIEWFSPVGPIQLMFSEPLNKQDDDKTAFFEFTMGQRF